MCGIAAIISEIPVEAAQMATWCLGFSTHMSHRGPDDEGFTLFTADGEGHHFRGNHSANGLNLPHISEAVGQYVAALVHRRLSIIGLGVKGHQPMQHHAGNLTMAYNGEAFNFKEIGHNLGYENQTNTDTEIVLELIAEKGIAGLNQLDGFFAGIVINGRKKQCTIFRDVTGVKPLYKKVAKGIQFYCSETKALRLVCETKAISPRGFLHFFADGLSYLGDNTTLFTGIQEFPKGEIQVFDFKCNPVEARQIEKRGVAPVNLEKRLEESIQMRLVSDVPLGFAVSGGLDSAAIIGVVRKLKPDAELSAFSIVSDNPEKDERLWQQKVIEFNRAQGWSSNISDAPATLLQTVVKNTDLPAVAWNNLAHFELCRMVKEAGVTVLFNGQGADEIFGGYPDYLMRSYGRYLRFANKSRSWPISNREIISGWRKLKLQSWLPDFVNAHIFKRKFQHLLHDDFNGHTSLLMAKSHMNAEEKMRDDYYGMKLGQMLLWEDRNGMANSIESRNPFADDKNLASFLNIPFKKKISNGFTKGILREALVHDVPKDVLWRIDKKGFSTPDGDLTKKFILDWKEMFFSPCLNDFSPLQKRELFWKKADQFSEKELENYFRLVSFSYFLEEVNG